MWLKLGYVYEMCMPFFKIHILIFFFHLFTYLGFNIAFREFGATVPSLWQTVMDFQRDRPEVVKHWPVREDSLWRFVTDNNGESYNLCHFWTNFEIASLDLWRSNDYLKFFNYLDQTGGFFYERYL